ncbi:hypothetical protein GIB67_022659 [Kingdonia uniflora]|uniref:Histone acetyltransferase n=1 Tax=Kingdonia uniflora TaxID=39325 RepID=A0A7J7P8A7_9MAGN|nr:hypothetical protein GIB67_022659 [Kingdonia uniflora]
MLLLLHFLVINIESQTSACDTHGAYKHQMKNIIYELSDMTAIKADDILATLQGLELIQYRKGQHAICADPKVLDRHLKAAGRGGLEVDVSKLIWTPYKDQS